MRYTRVLEATEKEILQGSQQRLGRVTTIVSFSRILFTAKQKQPSNLLLRFLSSKVSLRFESLINTRGGLGRLSPPLPTFRVRYTRRMLKATEKEILQGSQQRLGRVTVTVSYSRIFFTAKQV